MTEALTDRGRFFFISRRFLLAGLEDSICCSLRPMAVTQAVPD